MHRHQRVVAGQRGKLVGRGLEAEPGARRQFGGDAGGKFRMRVQAGADRGAAGGQQQQAGQGVLDQLFGVLELCHVAGKLLAQRQRRRILQVSAADLDDGGEVARLRRQRGAQLRQRRQHRLRHGQRRGHVHRGGKDIVRRLPHVDVVVRVQQAAFAARAAQQLGAAVGQHLVHVHVALGARAGLPHGQRKLVRMAAGQHFVGGAQDGVGLVGLEQAERAVHRGGGALHLGQRGDQFGRHALGRNMEVFQRALGLRAPQMGRGHLDRPETVLLDPAFHGEFLFFLGWD